MFFGETCSNCCSNCLRAERITTLVDTSLLWEKELEGKTDLNQNGLAFPPESFFNEVFIAGLRFLSDIVVDYANFFVIISEKYF